MFRLAVLFLAVTLLAAVFGFTTLATAAAEIAKILFFIFLGVFLASLLFGLTARA